MHHPNGQHTPEWEQGSGDGASSAQEDGIGSGPAGVGADAGGLSPSSSGLFPEWGIVIAVDCYRDMLLRALVKAFNCFENSILGFVESLLFKREGWIDMDTFVKSIRLLYYKVSLVAIPKLTFFLMPKFNAALVVKKTQKQIISGQRNTATKVFKFV